MPRPRHQEVPREAAWRNRVAPRLSPRPLRPHVALEAVGVPCERHVDDLPPLRGPECFGPPAPVQRVRHHGGHGLHAPARAAVHLHGLEVEGGCSCSGEEEDALGGGGAQEHQGAVGGGGGPVEGPVASE